MLSLSLTELHLSHPLTYSFTPSLTHPLTPHPSPPTHSPPHPSLTPHPPHSFIPSPLTHSSPHPSLTHPLTPHSLTSSSTHLPRNSSRLHVVGENDVIRPDVELPFVQTQNPRQDPPCVHAHPHVDVHPCRPVNFPGMRNKDTKSLS